MTSGTQGKINGNISLDNVTERIKYRKILNYNTILKAFDLSFFHIQIRTLSDGEVIKSLIKNDLRFHLLVDYDVAIWHFIVFASIRRTCTMPMGGLYLRTTNPSNR